MTGRTKITYLFDPLCGWCYGASPLMARLAAAPNLTIELAPTGLFSGAAARPMDTSFASFAWANDQQIASLTGQPFTEAYRNEVLAKGGMLDSGPATLALAAVALTEPQRQLDALRFIQEARYVSGLNVTDALVLLTLLEDLGFDAAAGRLASPDSELMEFHQDRLLTARDLMWDFSIRGVPGLVVDDGARKTLLKPQDLFGDSDLVARLTSSKLSFADTTPARHPTIKG